jgi:hypothetical protein
MTQKTVIAAALLIVAVLLFTPAVARADFITGQLWVNQTGASSNATLAQAAALGTSDATFSSGAFNYNSNVGGYTIGGFLNNPTFTNTSAAFTSNGGAAAGLNNTYFYFTGSIALNAGANSFVVGHDDGLQLNIDGIGLEVNAPGPTGFTNTPFIVNAPTAGNYSFEMSYGECCGAPAQLLWSVNGAVITGGTVPEPSTWTLMALGLGALIIVRRSTVKS